jgi:hypothetical protein
MVKAELLDTQKAAEQVKSEADETIKVVLAETAEQVKKVENQTTELIKTVAKAQEAAELTKELLVAGLPLNPPLLN